MALLANEPGVADMILLDPVTEDQLLKNLEIRFKESKIYVSLFFFFFLFNYFFKSTGCPTKNYFKVFFGIQSIVLINWKGFGGT